MKADAAEDLLPSKIAWMDLSIKVLALSTRVFSAPLSHG
jgi:hypothetical protein